MRTEFNATIRDAYTPLDKKERIQLKQQVGCLKIADLVDDRDGLMITGVKNLAVIDVHNEKAENTDYTIYIIITTDGERFSTSSKSLYESLNDIFDEMSEEDENGNMTVEPFDIKVIKAKSKNANGGSYFTCTII